MADAPDGNEDPPLPPPEEDWTPTETTWMRTRCNADSRTRCGLDAMLTDEKAKAMRDEKNEIEKKKRSSSSWKRLQKRLGRDETEKKKKKTEACSAHLSNIDNE